MDYDIDDIDIDDVDLNDDDIQDLITLESEGFFRSRGMLIKILRFQQSQLKTSTANQKHIPRTNKHKY